MISIEIALQILDIWLKTPFEGGRHVRRVKEIDVYEEGRGVNGMKAVAEE